MDNASKALIIAGGVLLAILVLTLLVAGLNVLSNIGEEQEKAKLAQQVQEFNSQYEAYNKNLLYHTDVMTVINKALDHNHRGGSQIKIIVETSAGVEVSFDSKSKTYSSKDELLGDLLPEGQKFAYYKCTKCEYNSSDKRISSMTFKDITLEIDPPETAS